MSLIDFDDNEGLEIRVSELNVICTCSLMNVPLMHTSALEIKILVGICVVNLTT